MEQLMESRPEANWDDELEELSALRLDKLNLNTATKDELERFPFLSDLQIENLLYYVYRYGPMLSDGELQLVYGFDYQTIQMLKPYITVEPPAGSGKHYPKVSSILKGGRHELLSHLDIPFYRRKGYDNAYTGTPQYNSVKYSFSYGDYFQAGLVAEKDAGEPLFAGSNGNGYDHYKGYVSIRDLGILKSLVIGSYKLSFGQGLVLNSNFRLGKTFSMSTSDFRATGIRKSASTDEYNYFNGAATTLKIMRNVELSAFYSRSELDAIIKDGRVTSIQSTGLHRTQTEIERRRSLVVQLAGGNLTWDINRLKLGVTGIYYSLDKELSPSLSGYRRYNMHGKSFYNMSFDYAVRLGRLQISGEEAKGKQGFALLNRISWSPSDNYNLLLLHRYYSEDYWSMYARSFGEGSSPQNENGWYVAAQVSSLAHWQFFASADLFSFPWWRYRISKSSQGQDIMLQTRYTPSESVSMYLNYRYKRRERDVSGSDPKLTLPTHHHKLRYRLTCDVGQLSLQTTADYNVFNQTAYSQGYLVSQMASYNLTALPLRLTVQGTYFNTDDYDSRVYSYERSLLYTFSSQSFSGRGYRLMGHLRFDFGKTLMFVAKIGWTHYTDRTEISSGNDLIPSNNKTDLQLQMRLRF